LVDGLASTPADQFDNAYITLQAQAHQEAITLFSAYAERGDNPRLVSFARQTLPTLRRNPEHVAMIAERR
jgi:putative membrane protein